MLTHLRTNARRRTELDHNKTCLRSTEYITILLFLSMRICLAVVCHTMRKYINSEFLPELVKSVTLIMSSCAKTGRNQSFFISIIVFPYMKYARSIELLYILMS